MPSFLDSVLCCGGGRKGPITSEYDSRYGAHDITAPFQGAYISPIVKPPAPYEPTNLPKLFPSGKPGGPYGLAPVKVRTRSDSTKSVVTIISTSPQLSPAFSTRSTAAVTTPGIAYVSLPVHSAYISGYSSSPPNSGNALATSPASQSASSFPQSVKAFSNTSSTATTPTAVPASPPAAAASPPLQSMPSLDRPTPTHGRRDRQIPTMVMSTRSPPTSPPTSPPFSQQQSRVQMPHLATEEVSRRRKNDFMGSPDSEMSVEQWPGTM